MGIGFIVSGVAKMQLGKKFDMVVAAALVRDDKKWPTPRADTEGDLVAFPCPEVRTGLGGSSSDPPRVHLLCSFD